VKKPALGKGMASLLATHVAVTEQQIEAGPPPKAVIGPSEAGPSELFFEKTSDEVKEPLFSEKPLLVPLEKIQLNPHQPRKIFHEKDIEELASSIKENGILQPLIVTQVEGKGFELIAGERRLRASKKLGLEKVPVIVKKATQRDKLVWAIIENIQRADLNCVEEALAYYQLMSEFKLTQEEVARKVGKERSGVANTLRLLKLPKVVLDWLKSNHLTFGHGKILASLYDDKEMIKWASLVVEEHLSVRELETRLSLNRGDGLEKNDESKKRKKTSSFLPDALRHTLKQWEHKTGLNIQIESKGEEEGIVHIKYFSKDEFNRIHEGLMSTNKARR
jgi:ParB family chromosome partitioning protein